MNAIEILKKHEKEIKKRFNVDKIGVFGSYARGEGKEESDVDILTSTNKIQKYVGNISLEDLLEDEMRIDAVVRNFEIKGEAASNISPELKKISLYRMAEDIGFQKCACS